MLALTDGLNTNDKRASLADRGNALTFALPIFQLRFGDFAQLIFNNQKKNKLFQATI